jgi:alpha-1,2-mannosyltransferase
VNGLRFTYPPFAAVGVSPLGLLPPRLAAGLWTAASVAALAGVVVVVRRALVGPHPGGWWPS